jgi:saccharopine dehydrogenase (NADP+, L-glutamate forming)
MKSTASTLITILGAGRSSQYLIDYLADAASKYQWHVQVGDIDADLAKSRIAGLPNCSAFTFDLSDDKSMGGLIKGSRAIVSMLPAHLHIQVAKLCLRHEVSLFTASYNTEDIKALHADAAAKGLLILMECGLDPGIDHMSAMRVVERLREQGHKLFAFETFTGGLIAPSETDDNPWQYRFTWNPRNVVLAGQGVVKFIQEGRYKYIPYHKLFRRTEVIHIPGYGFFEGYANRDSLKYRSIYQMDDLTTLYRGTLRRTGYCKAWDVFVQLGATDDSYQMEGVASMTHRQFINSFLSFNPHDSVELKLAHYLNLELDGEEMYKLKWLGIFEEEPVGLKKGSPAEVLEHILKKKWSLREEDKDMIVMWHKFDYIDAKSGVNRELHSHMVCIGEDQNKTGMAKTVGLPLAIAVEQYLVGNLKAKGVQIPVTPEIYNPILDGLEKTGIVFQERQVV